MAPCSCRVAEETIHCLVQEQVRLKDDKAKSIGFVISARPAKWGELMLRVGVAGTDGVGFP